MSESEMERIHLTLSRLIELPADAVLRDVRAFFPYGGVWNAWTRWPRANPAEIIDDMRLQRRFAPVLKWSCAEIRLPTPERGLSLVKQASSNGWLRWILALAPVA